MIDLIPDVGRRIPRVLCLGAHCDDIEIGCGATLLEFQTRRRRVIFDWVIFSGSSERRAETAQAYKTMVRPSNQGELLFGEFPDGRFPGAYTVVKEFAETLTRLPRPDLILSHERDDRHQDHRVVNEMTWNTFRNHVIFEYEIPKWDGGLGQPNVYVPVGAAAARRKVDTLLAAYATQEKRDWFERDVLMSLLRLRGVECRAPSGYAEAFHGRKLRVRGF